MSDSKCPYCGTILASTAGKCESCGRKIGIAESLDIEDDDDRSGRGDDAPQHLQWQSLCAVIVIVTAVVLGGVQEVGRSLPWFLLLLGMLWLGISRLRVWLHQR